MSDHSKDMPSHNQLTGVDYLLALNERHSGLFTTPGVVLERRRYRALHPTEICALKCMDGRLHLPVITNTGLGVIQPFRNLGGKFDVGWPLFGAEMLKWSEYAVRKGVGGLIIVTYHYSRGDVHRGCRGFGYNVDSARAEMAHLRDRLNQEIYFGGNAIYAILCGIETDLDSLIIHSDDDSSILDLATLKDGDIESLPNMLLDMHPRMSEAMRHDFLPLLLGNMEHIKEVRASNRPVNDVEHKEEVLGIGRGFDWLHEINLALLVGPWDPKIEEPIKIAADLIMSNIRDARLPKDQRIVLMTSSPYRDAAGPERKYAEAKARYLARLSREVIEKNVAELLPHLDYLIATVDQNSRKLDVLERSS